MAGITHSILRKQRWMALVGALGAVVVLTLLILAVDAGSEPASAASTGPEMALNIKGGACDDPVRPTKCDVSAGASFTLSVDALGIPAGGYDLLATALDLGTKLIYTQTAAAGDEILWPDVVIATRGTIGTVLVHGGLTALFPPLPVSTFTGNIVEIALACPVSASDSPVTIPLLPLGHPDAGTSGAQFQLAGVSTVPKVSSLTISCLAPTPTPTDTPTPTPTPTPTDTPTPTPCPPEGCPTATPTATATPPPAADFVVDSTADLNDANQGNGSCASAGGDCTLRAAVQEANALPGHQVILVPAGVYMLLKGNIWIDTDLTINGEGAPDTILDGAGATRIIYVDQGADVEISDLTMRNGWAFNASGGIHNSGTLTLNRTVVSGSLVGNASGGIGNSGTMTINDSTIKDNHADNASGGIGNGKGGVMTINNSTISGNSVGNAAGGVNNSGTMTINSSTISGNSADNVAGGIDNSSNGVLVINNSTVAHNEDGGIHNHNSLTMKNTLVANNGRFDCGGGITSLGHNLDSDGTCGLAATGDISNASALLGPLADNGGPTMTHALLPGSPAIDAGSNDCPPPAIDQRGVPRSVGGTCDISAFECQALGCIPPTPTPTPTPTPKNPDADTDGDTIPNSSDPDDDNDGCTDVQENGPDETLGGLRNPHNPHDFYDVYGPGQSLPPDGIIDLPNDILGVIQHFAPQGAPPYEVMLDRGVSSGPNPWNMTAPDGVIDLPNDILGVIQQFGHSCQ